jgi:hypothetical protein
VDLSAAPVATLVFLACSLATSRFFLSDCSWLENAATPMDATFFLVRTGFTRFGGPALTAFACFAGGDTFSTGFSVFTGSGGAGGGDAGSFCCNRILATAVDFIPGASRSISGNGSHGNTMASNRKYISRRLRIRLKRSSSLHVDSHGSAK